VIGSRAALTENRVSEEEGYGGMVKWAADLFYRSRSTRSYHRRDDKVVSVLD
jgi:hypothetical protein